MKVVAIFLLLAVGVGGIHAQSVTVWGYGYGRLLAEERLIAPWSFLKIQERTVTFRSVRISAPIAVYLAFSSVYHPFMCLIRRTARPSCGASCILTTKHHRESHQLSLWVESDNLGQP